MQESARQHHQRLRQLFHRVCELPSAARQGFLDAECAGDEQLRSDLEQLLTSASFATTGGLQPLLPVDATGPSETPLTQLGHYRIDGELGRGGMGVVYDAVDERLGRRVALKLLPATFAVEQQATIQREAQLLATLNHPHIATVYSLEEVDGVHFYTLERIRGSSLAEQLREGRLPIAQTTRVARQMSLALEAAHRAGIVHLDFKPGNVMVTEEGQVKVLDFGIARSLEQDATTREPSLTVAGTPGYMAPEQLAGAAVDERTDVWALGCVLFEMASGCACFAAATVADTVHATLHAHPDWTLLPDDAALLRPIIEKCLVRTREERIDSSADVRRLLERELGAALASDAVDFTPDTPTVSSAPLPRSLTSFVGRQPLLDEITAELHRERLVSLTGLGGSGKTRLAIEVARRVESGFSGGACWIDLAALNDADALVPHMAAALDVRVASLDTATLVTELRDRETLLVIDNCEHVLAAAGQLIEAILAGCAGVRVLATTRAPLEVAGEKTIGVPPLALPADDAVSIEALCKSESAQLFLDRAARHNFELTQQNAAAVASICRRLDGIPLAIELATARLQVLSATELDRRLEHRFRLLTRGQSNAPQRQRTLRATLDWSYELLTEDEKRLLQRLSIFAGSWTLHAAEEVCTGMSIDSWEVLDLLSGLIAKSLVVVVNDDGERAGRYRFLETVRSYARERLRECDDAEVTEVTRNYVEHFRRLSVEALPHLEGPLQGRWFARLDVDAENLFRALELCRDPLQDFATGTEISVNVWAYFDVRFAIRRAAPLLRALVDEAPAEAMPDTLRAKALNAIGMMLVDLEEFEAAQSYYARCIDFCLAHGYEANAAVVSMNIAILIKKLGDYDGARQRYLESIEITRRLGQEARLVMLLLNLGILESEQNKADVAQRYLDEGLDLARRREEPHTLACFLGALGTLSGNEAQHERARDYHLEAEQLFRELGDRTGVARTMGNRAIALEQLGDVQGAHDLLVESLEIRRELGNQHGIAIALVNLAPTLLRLGHWDKSRQVLAECLTRVNNSRTLAYALEATAELADSRGDGSVATQLFAAAHALRQEISVPLPRSTAGATQQLLAALEAALGADEFRSATQLGATLDAAEATQLAALYCSKETT